MRVCYIWDSVSSFFMFPRPIGISINPIWMHFQTILFNILKHMRCTFPLKLIKLIKRCWKDPKRPVQSNWSKLTINQWMLIKKRQMDKNLCETFVRSRKMKVEMKFISNTQYQINQAKPYFLLLNYIITVLFDVEKGE